MDEFRLNNILNKHCISLFIIKIVLFCIIVAMFITPSFADIANCSLLYAIIKY